MKTGDKRNVPHFFYEWKLVNVPPGSKFRPQVSFIGQLVANDAKVSRNILVQLFCLFSSGSIGSRYKYERTAILG